MSEASNSTPPASAESAHRADAPAETTSATGDDAAKDEVLLRVNDLCVDLAAPRGGSAGRAVQAIRGVSFEVHRGTVFALVGVTGSGKSEIALSLTGLLPGNWARVRDGEVWFDGENLLTLPQQRLRHLRATRIAYLFREPDSLLNPLYTIGEHLAEALGRPGRKLTPEQHQQVTEQFYEVGLVEPEMILPRRPFDLKLSVRQRVMLATALLGGAELIIADEPTAELDAMAEMQFIELLMDLRERLGLTVLLATHNFGIVEGLANEVAVLFSGGIVEAGNSAEVLRNPANAYTRQLISSVPRLGERRSRLGELDAEGVRAGYDAVGKEG